MRSIAPSISLISNITSFVYKSFTGDVIFLVKANLLAKKAFFGVTQESLKEIFCVSLKF